MLVPRSRFETPTLGPRQGDQSVAIFQLFDGSRGRSVPVLIDEDLALIVIYWPCTRLLWRQSLTRAFYSTHRVQSPTVRKRPDALRGSNLKTGKMSGSIFTTPFPSTNVAAKTGKLPGFRTIVSYAVCVPERNAGGN